MKSFSLLLALTLIAGPLVAQNGPTVEEIAIATDVADREPQGVMQTFPADVGQVVCWTRINGAEDGTQIEHVWYRDDQEMARVSLNVGGPTWRTWSRKAIPAEWSGSWRVDVVTADGTVLESASFTVQ